MSRRWTQRQLLIAVGAMIHGAQRAHGGSHGPASDVLTWIRLVEDEIAYAPMTHGNEER